MNQTWFQPEKTDDCPGKPARSDMKSVRIHVKVVPGSRRAGFAGVLGNRLKIRVAAPPEDGKANRAVSSLLAELFGVSERHIELIVGHGSPEKTFRISGISVEQVAERIKSA
jgi:uncharacterized protein (TIGR00251 family)